MTDYPIFLSVVCVVRNQSDRLKRFLKDATEVMQPLVSDYEIIIVDNASEDKSVSTLKALTGVDGLPNLQVFALTKEVDSDSASWVGLENALGDFVLVIDPRTDDLAFLPEMLEEATAGFDVVFANNQKRPRQSMAYRAANAAFNSIYKVFGGVDLAKEAPQYRLLSRTVINFILRHPQPSVTYRHLPATGGFSKKHLKYSSEPLANKTKRLSESFDRGMKLLVSTTRAPMRFVTSLSLFGALANLSYSVYVLAVVILKDDVAQGWASISLQMSGMFFLISLVLLVLGEYILNMASVSNEGPPYHVGQEFNSAKITRKGKLNIEEVSVSNGATAQPAKTNA